MSGVLVTGASGFVGRHVVRALTGRGDEVHAVARHAPVDADDGATWHRTDLLNTAETAALIAGLRPDRLVHLAWCAKPGRFWSDPENLRWTGATLELVRAFVHAGGQRLLITGSGAEYAPDAGRCSERDTPCAPETFYGVCKHATHSVVAAYCEQADVELAWARLFMLFGPGEHPERLVADAVRALLAGRPFECTDGSQRRDLLYVVDAADALATLLDGEVSGPVNVASGESPTLREVISAIAERLGRADLVRFGARPRPPGDPDLVAADVTRLTDEAGWRAAHSRDGALDETIEWWRANPGI